MLSFSELNVVQCSMTYWQEGGESVLYTGLSYSTVLFTFWVLN